MSITLESHRLNIDEITFEDVQAIHAYASDLEVVRYQNWGPNSYAQTEAFVRQVLYWQRQSPRLFMVLAIRSKNTKGLIGAVSLELDPSLLHGNIGFSLAREAWGQGLATEAALALITYASHSLSLTELVATCDCRNLASQRVLQKCGFKPVGVIPQHMMLRDGPRDTLLFEIRLQSS